jgi:hypothetical protein
MRMLRDFAFVLGVLLLTGCLEHDAVGTTFGSEDSPFEQYRSLQPEARRLEAISQMAEQYQDAA